MSQKQDEFLQLLQERNNLKKKIAQKSSGSQNEARERGFVTHFAGANASSSKESRPKSGSMFRGKSAENNKRGWAAAPPKAILGVEVSGGRGGTPPRSSELVRPVIVVPKVLSGSPATLNSGKSESAKVAVSDDDEIDYDDDFELGNELTEPDEESIVIPNLDLNLESGVASDVAGLSTAYSASSGIVNCHSHSRLSASPIVCLSSPTANSSNSVAVPEDSQSQPRVSQEILSKLSDLDAEKQRKLLLLLAQLESEDEDAAEKGSNSVPAPNMSQPVQSPNAPVVDGVVNVSPTLDAPINESSEDASVGVSSQRIDEETLITNNIVEDIPAKVVERVNTPAEQERVYMYQNVLDEFAIKIRIYNGWSSSPSSYGKPVRQFVAVRNLALICRVPVDVTGGGSDQPMGVNVDLAAFRLKLISGLSALPPNAECMRSAPTSLFLKSPSSGGNAGRYQPALVNCSGAGNELSTYMSVNTWKAPLDGDKPLDIVLEYCGTASEFDPNQPAEIQKLLHWWVSICKLSRESFMESLELWLWNAEANDASATAPVKDIDVFMNKKCIWSGQLSPKHGLDESVKVVKLVKTTPSSATTTSVPVNASDPVLTSSSIRDSPMELKPTPDRNILVDSMIPQHNAVTSPIWMNGIRSSFMKNDEDDDNPPFPTDDVVPKRKISSRRGKPLTGIVMEEQTDNRASRRQPTLPQASSGEPQALRPKSKRGRTVEDIMAAEPMTFVGIDRNSSRGQPSGQLSGEPSSESTDKKDVVCLSAQGEEHGERGTGMSTPSKEKRPQRRRSSLLEASTEADGGGVSSSGQSDPLHEELCKGAGVGSTPSTNNNVIDNSPSEGLSGSGKKARSKRINNVNAVLANLSSAMDEINKNTELTNVLNLSPNRKLKKDTSGHANPENVASQDSIGSGELQSAAPAAVLLVKSMVMKEDTPLVAQAQGNSHLLDNVSAEYRTCSDEDTVAASVPAVNIMIATADIPVPCTVDMAGSDMHDMKERGIAPTQPPSEEEDDYAFILREFGHTEVTPIKKVQQQTSARPPEQQEAPISSMPPPALYDGSSILCQRLTFKLDTTWGDSSYVGLCGLQVLEYPHGNAVPVNPANIVADPRDMSAVGVFDDKRLPENLLSGANNTTDETQMWIIPFTNGSSHILQFNLDDSIQLMGFRVWNYNKNADDILRGVRFMSVFGSSDLSQSVGMNSYLGQVALRPGPGCDGVAFEQTVLLSDFVTASTGGGPNSSPVAGGKSSCPFSRQDYEVQSMPFGMSWKFSFLSNWCDGYYIGLDGIEMFDEKGAWIDVSKLAVVSAVPYSIHDITNDDTGLEDRIPINLFKNRAHITHQQQSSTSWLAPLSQCMTGEERRTTVKRLSHNNLHHQHCDTHAGHGNASINLNRAFVLYPNNVLFVLFHKPIQISFIRIHNYSKTPARGVADYSIEADNNLLYRGTLIPYSPEVFKSTQGQTVLFSSNPDIVKSEKDKVMYCGSEDQDVLCINERQVMTKSKSMYSIQPNAACEGVKPNLQHRPGTSAKR